MNFRLSIFSLALLIALPSYAAKIDPFAIIVAHNKLRAEVGVSNKISYSNALAASAQSWADHLKQTNGCKMRHSVPNGKYGENLFWGSALEWTDGRREVQKITSQRVVEEWGKEKSDYDYTDNSCAFGKMCGHYTQIVWRSTTMVGCGVAVCNDTKEQVWACQYQPAGNWVGKRPY